jgi:hypothetical protein
MAGFLFRLETVDGVAADPPTLEAAVPDWRPGHSIYLGDIRPTRAAESFRPTPRGPHGP